MRRFLTFLTAVALLSVSLAIGVFTADLPFWRRAIDLPLEDGERYLPVAYSGDTASLGSARASLRADSDISTAHGLVARFRGSRADALLVMRAGRIRIEEYSSGDGSHLLPADFIARPLSAIAVGAAVADGRLASIDEPVAKYLPEWDDEPRGRISLRELLEETSGLARGIEPAALLGSHPFDKLTKLPRFATSRAVRLVIGNDFESTALGFPLEHEPGGFFNVSPVNPQLAAVIVERASGTHYVDFLERHLRLAEGAFRAEYSLDRRSGMPAAHCCMRASGRDVLYLAEMLRNDGQAGGVRILPAGWVAKMLEGSRANPEFGQQLSRAKRGHDDIWYAGGEEGGAFWIVPARELTVVVLAPRSVPVDWGILDGAIVDVSK